MFPDCGGLQQPIGSWGGWVWSLYACGALGYETAWAPSGLRSVSKEAQENNNQVEIIGTFWLLKGDC